MKYVRVILTAVLFTPSLALAAPRTFNELVNMLVTFLDAATGVLIVAGIVIYFFGISTGLVSQGETSQAKLKTYIMWGLVVLFVMVSIWGIVRVLQNTLFASDPYSPDVGSPGFGDPFVPSQFAE